MLWQYNFGLHDLARDNERIEPNVYTQLLANITQRLADAAPQAKIIWVTSTPIRESRSVFPAVRSALADEV